MQSIIKAEPPLVIDGTRHLIPRRKTNNKGQSLIRIVLSNKAQLRTLLTTKTPLPGGSAPTDLRPWPAPISVGHISLLNPIPSLNSLNDAITSALASNKSFPFSLIWTEADPIRPRSGNYIVRAAFTAKLPSHNAPLLLTLPWEPHQSHRVIWETLPPFRSGWGMATRMWWASDPGAPPASPPPYTSAQAATPASPAPSPHKPLPPPTLSSVPIEEAAATPISTPLPPASPSHAVAASQHSPSAEPSANSDADSASAPASPSPASPPAVARTTTCQVCFESAPATGHPGCEKEPGDEQRRLVDLNLSTHHLRRVAVPGDGKCLLTALSRSLPNNPSAQQIFAEAWKAAQLSEFGGSDKLSGEDGFLTDDHKAELRKLDVNTAYRLYTCGSFATLQDGAPASPAADQAARDTMGAFSDTSVLRFATAAYTRDVFSITRCASVVTQWSARNFGPVECSFADASAALLERAYPAIAVVHLNHPALHYDLVASTAAVTGCTPDNSDMVPISSGSDAPIPSSHPRSMLQTTLPFAPLAPQTPSGPPSSFPPTERDSPSSAVPANDWVKAHKRRQSKSKQKAASGVRPSASPRSPTSGSPPQSAGKNSLAAEGEPLRESLLSLFTRVVRKAMVTADSSNDDLDLIAMHVQAIARSLGRLRGNLCRDILGLVQTDNLDAAVLALASDAVFLDFKRRSKNRAERHNNNFVRR